MGEDKAFEYMKQLHPNINAYARSGTGPIKAVARGETSVSLSFVHDAVTEKNAGFPVAYATPCEGTGYEIGSMSILKGARNLVSAQKFYDWALTADAQKLGYDVGKQLQMPSSKEAPAAAGRAGPDQNEARELRLREIWSCRRTSPSARALGSGNRLAAALTSDTQNKVLGRQGVNRMRHFFKRTSIWLLAFVGIVILPWHMLEDALTLPRLFGLAAGDADNASAVAEAARFGRFWLWPPIMALVLASRLPPCALRGRGPLFSSGSPAGWASPALCCRAG